MANLADIHVGDQVQITKSAIDITNGVKAGRRYTEGTSEWGYVQGIYPNWTATYGANRGKKVTKVRITGTDKSTVVWQVEPDHVSDNIIHLNGCGKKVPEPTPPVAAPKPPVEKPKPPSITSPSAPDLSSTDGTGPIPTDAYVTSPRSDTWLPPGDDMDYAKLTRGYQSGELSGERNPDGGAVVSETQLLSAAPYDALLATPNVTYKTTRVPGPDGKLAGPDIEKAVVHTMASTGMKQLLLNSDASTVQNVHSYPQISTKENVDKLIPAMYDYSIIPGDSRFPKMVALEDQLMQARASLGLPVHGDNDIAKTMRYFLYNRFKSPDTNLAHNKSFTHIFFSRPDINILEGPQGKMDIATQCKHHTEASMTWMRNPNLFKLLVNGKRCGDSNNFNMLLSNAATSVSIEDESLTYVEAGKSWGEHAIQYGDSYSGQSAGDLTVNFTDDKEYSVITLMKLWITYISNVAKGAWIPSYNLGGSCDEVSQYITGSHVYTRTLDYAASIDVIKTNELGSEIIYWTKYYGIFPITTGASALSWDNASSPGDAPKLNIRFRYSYKRDLSPVALLEFNANAMVTDGTTGNIVDYERQWSDAVNHSNRPYVGTPFIQFDFPKHPLTLKSNWVNQQKTAKLRLQFLTANALLAEQVDADAQIFKHSGI